MAGQRRRWRPTLLRQTSEGNSTSRTGGLHFCGHAPVPEIKGEPREEIERDRTGGRSDVHRPTRGHLFGQYRVRQRIANQTGGRVDITEVGSISRLVATFLMLYLSLGASRVSAQPAANASTLLTIEASAPATVPETTTFKWEAQRRPRARWPRPVGEQPLSDAGRQALASGHGRVSLHPLSRAVLGRRNPENESGWCPDRRNLCVLDPS